MPALTHASILFHTNGNDKDDNTHVTATVRDNDGSIVARIDNDFGHFNDDSDSGPFNLEVLSPAEKATMGNGSVTLRIDPDGGDTWLFNFALRLKFSDGTTIACENDGLELTEVLQQTTFGLG
jgi:hypothetical protein